MNELKFKNYQDRFNLHYLATDKFKTNLVQIYFMLPLRTSKEAAMTALIPSILKRGSQNFPNHRLLKTELESLYGSNLGFNILKRGENQILRFSLEIVNEKFLTEKSELTENALKLFNEILFNPLTEKGAFKERYFEQERKILKEKISALINDKYSYTVERCISKMCQDEKYGIYKLGTAEALDQITNKELYNHYQNLLANVQRSLFLVGDFKAGFEEDIFAETELKAGKDIFDQETEVFYNPQQINSYQEELKINQAKLAVGFRTGITREMTAYYSLLVFNSLIGGSTHSRLFREVREKRSLAYYISSSIETTKGLMLINGGINAENKEEVLELIKKEIKALAAGDFTEEEFQRAKKSVINSLKQDLDSSKALASHYLLSLINKKEESIARTIAGVEAVETKDINDTAEKLKLDTVYLLKSEV